MRKLIFISTFCIGLASTAAHSQQKGTAVAVTHQGNEIVFLTSSNSVAKIRKELEQETSQPLESVISRILPNHLIYYRTESGTRRVSRVIEVSDDIEWSNEGISVKVSANSSLSRPEPAENEPPIELPGSKVDDLTSATMLPPSEPGLSDPGPSAPMAPQEPPLSPEAPEAPLLPEQPSAYSTAASPTDVGADYGPQSSSNFGPEAGPESSSNFGPEAGPESGSYLGPEAGPESGSNFGPEAGPGQLRPDEPSFPPGFDDSLHQNHPPGALKP